MKSSTGNVQAVKYRATKDKSDGKPKVVYRLTTEGPASMAPSGKSDKVGNPIVKPACVNSYNLNMGGVDMTDQQLHSVSLVRKTYKWYLKIALRLFMQCVLSAHKLHTKITDSKAEFLEDFKALIGILISSSPKLNLTVYRSDLVYRLSGRHFPSQRDEDSSGKAKHKMCRVCWARGLRTTNDKAIKTVWICPDCPDEPGLHAKVCFRIYRTQLDCSS